MNSSNTFIFVCLVLISVTFTACNKSEEKEAYRIESLSANSSNTSSLYPMINFINLPDSLNVYFIGSYSASFNPLSLNYLMIEDLYKDVVIFTSFKNKVPIYTYYVDTKTSLRQNTLIEYEIIPGGFNVNTYNFNWDTYKGTLIQSVEFLTGSEGFNTKVTYDKPVSKSIFNTDALNETYSEYTGYNDLLSDYFGTGIIFSGIEWLYASGKLTLLWNDMLKDVSLARAHKYLALINRQVQTSLSDNSISQASTSKYVSLNQLLNKLRLSEFKYLDINSDKVNTTTFVTIDKRVYPAVKIGDQLWLAENLKATNDKSGNPVVCYDYAESPDNTVIYGKLYTWESAQNLCPNGWHLPTEADWSTLSNFVGGFVSGGGSLKPGGNTQFNAQLSGFRSADGTYSKIRTYVGYWTSGVDAGLGVGFGLSTQNETISKFSLDKNLAFSVRCIKD